MIRDFMQEIGRGQAVVVVISDKYLKSPNCMFELVEIVKNKDVRDRIFPVVLQDADIYNPVNRIRYVKHWEDKLKELDEAMHSVSATNLQGMREEIDTYDAIRDHLAGLTFMLKDMNTLTPEMHENSNFSMLIASLEKRLKDAAPSVLRVAAPAPAAALPQGIPPAARSNADAEQSGSRPAPWWLASVNRGAVALICLILLLVAWLYVRQDSRPMRTGEPLAAEPASRPANVVEVIQRGNRLRADGDYEKAVNAYTEALTSDPNNFAVVQESWVRSALSCTLRQGG